MLVFAYDPVCHIESEESQAATRLDSSHYGCKLLVNTSANRPVSIQAITVSKPESEPVSKLGSKLVNQSVNNARWLRHFF